MPILCTVTMGLCCAASVGAETLSPARQREILRDALHAYDEAVELARDNPTRARDLYQQAAGGLRALREAGVQNTALEYNLGNVYFRLGDLGRAILHYRRAQRLNPRDPRLEANLRYARERVEPAIPPSGQSRLAQQLLFWHYHTSIAQRWQALLLLSVAGWVLLFGWLWARRNALLLAGLIGVALALAAGASIRWQIADVTRQPEAVIIEDGQYLRLGRGEGADLALKQPLGAGVEVRVLEQRGDWVEVRLANDQRGWLPADAIGRV